MHGYEEMIRRAQERARDEEWPEEVTRLRMALHDIRAQAVFAAIDEPSREQMLAIDRIAAKALAAAGD